MNNVSLVGRLTKDVDFKTTESGVNIANFSIAVNRKFQKEGQPTADFINIVAFGKTAEFVSKYFTKGMAIGLTGEIRVDTYEKDGNKVWTTKVITNEVEFVEKKSNNEQVNQTTGNEQGKEDGFLPLDNDDELPF